jgi:serine/threonine protein phosphatase PrpC
MTKVRSIFITDVGSKRAKNQDNGLASPEYGFCVIADGMGGHRGGETASRIAVEKQSESLIRPSQGKPLPDRMIEGLRQAHDSIYQMSQENESLRGMGTTSTFLALDDSKNPSEAWITHVGDSRCYLVKPGAIWQLTRDHSMVQEKLRAGLITREQLKTDVMRNVITRSVGFELQLDPDLYHLEVSSNDLFLLCSDGLTGQLEDLEILAVVDECRPSRDWEECARRLIALANERGGDDNISVGILDIGD